jgi:hypothetical protein
MGSFVGHCPDFPLAGFIKRLAKNGGGPQRIDHEILNLAIQEPRDVLLQTPFENET